MNDIIFNRLYSLISRLLPSLDSDNSTKSLLYAVACGLAMMSNTLDEAFDDSFVQTMSSQMLDSYCRAFSVSLSLSDEEKRAQLKNIASLGWQEYNADEFLDYYKSLGDGFDAYAVGFALTLEGLRRDNPQLMHEVMNRLELYQPPCVSVKLNRSGLTFDEWDEPDMDFGTVDYLDAPFSVLETL